MAEYSWRGLARQAGTNCVNACVNVLALSMALVGIAIAYSWSMRALPTSIVNRMGFEHQSEVHEKGFREK